MKDKYLIRLKRPLTDAALKIMNKRFGNILSSGKFEPLDDNLLDDDQGRYLYRLVFHFDRSSYAGLRQLIDYLNTLS